MRKAILVYNPLSGDHSIPQKLDYILGNFQDKGILVQPYRFMNERYVPGLVEGLREQSFDYIIISGGDGTINTVVNLLLKNGFTMPIGIIPSGTCNDFASSLNIPCDFDKCLDIILSGNSIDVDVGLVNEERYFLSTCAGGAFVNVSFSTNHELKKNFGPFAYYLQAITEVGNIKPYTVSLTTEEGTIKEEILLFLILNGRHGAGLPNLMKEADITDGLMDIVLIKNASHIDLAGLFFKVLTSDTFSDRNIVKIKTSQCTMEGDDGMSVSIDGEKGDGLPMTVRFINRGLRVFVR